MVAAAALGTEGALQAVTARVILQTRGKNLIYRAESCSVQVGNIRLAAVSLRVRDTGTEDRGKDLQSRDDSLLRWLAYVFNILDF